MNVLYIDHYAGSNSMGMEFRPFYLATVWKEMGINTTILAADFSHLRKNNPEVTKSMELKKIDGIDFIFIKTVKYKGNGIGRIKSMFDFISKGVLSAEKIAEKTKPDVIISSSTYPLDTYISQRIKKYSGAQIIHEIHDLWPLSPIELGGYNKNHPFIKIMQYGENSAYRNSDAVVSILPNTEPYIRSLGFKTPVFNIPNGLLESDFLNAENTDLANKEVKKLIDKLHSDGKFIVGYSGGISVSNAMDDFIYALIKLNDNEKIASVIIGSGILKQNLMNLKEKYKLNNVYFVDKIDKNEVVSTLKLMDALYIGSKKSKLYQYGVSANKIFDYMLAGKPIINAFDSNHSPMIYAGNTFVAEAENSNDIAEKILETQNLSTEKRDKIQQESREYVQVNHNYKILAEKFADLFKNNSKETIND